MAAGGPAPADGAVEAGALRLSLIASAGIAVVGIAWGIAAESQMILFDGVYSLIGGALAWLSVRAARLVAAGPTRTYPRGRDALTPMVVAVQAIALVATCVYAIFEAVMSIREESSDVDAGAALLYGVFTLILGVAVWSRLRRSADGSDLVGAAAQQWLGDTVLSVAMVLGFGTAVVLGGVGHSEVATYIDPVMLAIAAAAFIPAPVRTLRGALVELLERRPTRDIRVPVEAVVEGVRHRFGLDDPTVRMVKLGRRLEVEVDFIVPPDSWDVDREDQVRRAVRDGLAQLPFELRVDADVSTDPSLTK